MVWLFSPNHPEGCTSQNSAFPFRISALGAVPLPSKHSFSVASLHKAIALPLLCLAATAFTRPCCAFPFQLSAFSAVASALRAEPCLRNAFLRHSSAIRTLLSSAQLFISLADLTRAIPFPLFGPPASAMPKRIQAFQFPRDPLLFLRSRVVVLLRPTSAFPLLSSQTFS